MKVGDKVICITKLVWGDISHNEKTPKYGDVLTIRQAKVFGKFLLLRFEEIVNPKYHYLQGKLFMEYCFDSRKFRKLENHSLKTHEVELNEIIDPVKQHQLA